MSGGHMDGLDWLWGSLMMGFWVIVIALAVFIAVRLANRDRHPHSRT